VTTHDGSGLRDHEVRARAHGAHGHTHGSIDPSIAATSAGMRAVAWSFAILGITAAAQFLVVVASGSVALLADTIHNISDAATAVPLWIAFWFARRPPSPRFAYGFGRVEDLAGIAIVIIIFASAVVAGYEAIDHILYPRAINQLSWIAIAGVVGFLGNEGVAILRIRVGRKIESVALVADGYHARADGLTSLAVVAGAVGVWLGFPLADPVVGLLIAAAILVIVWRSAAAVFTRVLDGVEPGTLEEIQHTASHVRGAKVVEARARWSGHRLYADLAIAVDQTQSVAAACGIATALERELLDHVPALAAVNVRFAPPTGV
jgi:cation diffusion facilitator family transporter